MKDYTLILYGGYTMTGNPNVFTSETDDMRSVVMVQTVKNARSAGRAVVNRDIDEKNIQFTTTVISDTTKEALDVWQELQEEFETVGRYLRISPIWDMITSLDSVDNYQLSGDATNKLLSTTRRVFGAGIQFDIIVGLSGDDFAVITNESLTGLNLGDFENQGNFEVSLYIPDASYITSVTLKIGSDSSNYGTYTFTSQYDDSPITDGWNYFSIPWSDLALTGAIDPTIVGAFTEVRIDFTEDQEDTLGVVLGGVLWQYDDRSVNYVSFFQGHEMEKLDRRAGRIGAKLQFLVPEGIGESTALKILNSLSEQTSASKTIVSTFHGTYEPKPIIRMVLSTVTNLSSVILTNITTGDTVTVTPTSWSAGDVLEFNMRTRQVLLNNRPIAYSSVLPRFRIGRNKLNISLTSTSQSTISQTTNNTNLKGQG